MPQSSVLTLRALRAAAARNQPSDSPCPAHYSERSLLLLGYDMRKRHNYLSIESDELTGDDFHLLDRYNHNLTTLCGQDVQSFDVAQNGVAFCRDCYNVLLQRAHI